MLRPAILAASLLLALATAQPAQAAAIVPTISRTAGASYNTTVAVNSIVGGHQMAGLAVTATFANGATQTASWAATGANSGAAAGTNWSVGFSGINTASAANWVVTNARSSALTALSLNGVPGLIAFDSVLFLSAPSAKSPGSLLGWPIGNVTGPAGRTLAATYTNRLLVANTFYTDLYTRLDLAIGGGGLATGQTLSFAQDTDRAVNMTALAPPVPVPAPGAALLFGTAMLGLLGLRRRAVRPAA